MTTVGSSPRRTFITLKTKFHISKAVTSTVPIKARSEAVLSVMTRVWRGHLRYARARGVQSCTLVWPVSTREIGRIMRLRHLILVIAAAVVLPAQDMHNHALEVHGVPGGVPEFCPNPTITSVASGAWSNPATSSTKRAPAAGD